VGKIKSLSSLVAYEKVRSVKSGAGRGGGLKTGKKIKIIGREKDLGGGKRKDTSAIEGRRNGGRIDKGGIGGNMSEILKKTYR